MLFLGAATVSLGPICQQLSIACLIYHDNPCLTQASSQTLDQIIELEFKGVQISCHLGNSQCARAEKRDPGSQCLHMLTSPNNLDTMP